MSAHNRVIWHEGLFLQPQHFQQQDRYFERYIESRCRSLIPNSWGFTDIEFEFELLKVGKIGLTRLAGVPPDGTPFRMPDDDPLPPPIDIGTEIRDQRLFLAVPLRRPGELEVARGPDSEDLARDVAREFEAPDASVSGSERAILRVPRYGAGCSSRVG